ncbi:peptidase [Agrobacterium sp. a22-2]|uniref:A24 family peptidase n=1 Tax=Agrobacterium sp. a22-2 TaxID=2283840 RepID=UPI00144584C5|nr:prepilin peptidase [Agrobacterium sp. a22-2]NKN35328.1 peptidase [Agrobacterium sp. a22-2]
MVEAIVFVIFPLCLTLAAFTDFLEMTIPNRIPVVLLGAFAIAAPLAGLGVTDIGFHLLAGLVVFAVCFALFAFNVMGGGDAKLLTAAAVWFGLNLSLVSFLVNVAYIGGALTLLILLLRARSNTMMAIGLPLPGSILHAKKIPYGIAIGIAGLLTYPQSPLVLWAMQP